MADSEVPNSKQRQDRADVAVSESRPVRLKRKHLSRRAFLRAGACGFIFLPSVGRSLDLGRSEMTLLTAPIELAGEWGHMLPSSATSVVERMRHACLDGVRLVSDRQPAKLRVDEHTSGLPSIWLHSGEPTTAWIIVDIGERDWSKLAYQFGHELGHVFANSWQIEAKSAPPCQWLEEAMVEAFSLRGLARLAESWKQDPPFANDNAFGDAIAKYRQDIIDRYSGLASEQQIEPDFAAWFRRNRNDIEADALSNFAKAAALTLLAEYEREPACVEALGALNRWPGRSGVPINDYLGAWTSSCAELAANSYLPTRLRKLLQQV